MDVFHNKEIIFLDTNLNDKNNKNSYIFINPIKKIIVFDADNFKKAFAEINELSKKYWIVGYIRYEAGYYFLPKIFGNDKFIQPDGKPLIWFGVYEKPVEIAKEQNFFVYKPYLRFEKQLPFDTYQQKIQQIKHEIKKGNTYQVNFTFDNLLTAETSDENLYFSLREEQKTAYSAFIRNEFDTILSFSPELFFRIDENKISVKPMKGTIARGGNENEDKNLIAKISKDEKIKAENLMIVDLLRNDLGRIAKNGTVKVENLLDIETHSTLHQITSSVSAELENFDFFEIFKALFPCGSVTGAPKIETMKIIKNLEQVNRGVYCGAIGYISPDQKNRKSVFSVPIRILQKVSEKQWNYKVGGGIVWDSIAEDEWKETETKTLFLQKNKVDDFGLIETMLFQNGKILFKKEHLERLENSANFFEFKLDTKLIDFELDKIVLEASEQNKKFILRLEIDENGNFHVEKLEFIKSLEKVESTKISEIVLDKKNIFLKHKTTYRPWYEQTKELIKNKKIWDEIFVNQDGEICEGSRTNVFVEIDGELFTPPLSAGLLNGIFRQDLINRGKCAEKKLYLDDLKKAETVYLGNSVRGLVRVKIINLKI